MGPQDNWPKSKQDVTVEGIMRSVAADTQLQWLRKTEEMESKDYMLSPLYVTRTLCILGAVGLLACFDAFKRANPEAALEFAREYWSLCEDGGEFGPRLWELGTAAGLDMEAVRLPEGEAGR